MSIESVQAFNDTVAASPELQTKLRQVTSPMDVVALAKSVGVDLTGEDLQYIAQQAYLQWCEQLEPKMRDFFNQVHNSPELNAQLKACQSLESVTLLAKQCGLEISQTDLNRAASAAESVPGFSFEKLWFRGLGLIG